MKPSAEEIGKLLALKRHERPEEGYWQEFLGDFHQSQREQAVRKFRSKRVSRHAVPALKIGGMDETSMPLIGEIRRETR